MIQNLKGLRITKVMGFNSQVQKKKGENKDF